MNILESVGRGVKMNIDEERVVGVFGWLCMLAATQNMIDGYFGSNGGMIVPFAIGYALCIYQIINIEYKEQFKEVLQTVVYV